MGVFYLHGSFSCTDFSRVDLRLYHSERRELPRGRVFFVNAGLVARGVCRAASGLESHRVNCVAFSHYYLAWRASGVEGK